MERWLDLSQELHLARLGATEFVNEQNEFDTFLPTIVVKNNGRSDVTLSPEDSKYVQTWAVSAASMNECYNNKHLLTGTRAAYEAVVICDRQCGRIPTSAVSQNASYPEGYSPA